MVEATIKMTVPHEKRKEVLQTLQALLDPIRHERGCLTCNCYVDVEAENNIFFEEQWECSEDLDTHLRSVRFGILIGAMKLLHNDPDIRFCTISSSSGVESIQAARG